MVRRHEQPRSTTIHAAEFVERYGSSPLATSQTFRLFDLSIDLNHIETSDGLYVTPEERRKGAASFKLSQTY
ncbi:hypothetical protein [Schaalia cardiffensis]